MISGDFVIGILFGASFASTAWLVVWVSALSHANEAGAALKASHAREEALEARLERETADDWWKGEDQ